MHCKASYPVYRELNESFFSLAKSCHLIWNRKMLWRLAFRGKKGGGVREVITNIPTLLSLSNLFFERRLIFQGISSLLYLYTFHGGWMKKKKKMKKRKRRRKRRNRRGRRRKRRKFSQNFSLAQIFWSVFKITGKCNYLVNWSVKTIQITPTTQIFFYWGEFPSSKLSK